MPATLPQNRFKSLLNEQAQIGIWSTLCSNIVIDALSDSGFDWVLLDTEHSPNELPNVVTQLQALAGTQTAAVVRPAWNDPVLIKRFLDIGAQTLLIPFVQTAEEAERAVAAVRYPNQGIRGVAAAHRANRYGRVPDYVHRANDELCLIVQVETSRAIDNIPAIAAVEGVDAIFIGPSDLAADMGHIGEAGHAEVQREIARGLALCREHRMPAGILAPVQEQAEHWLDAGFAFIAVASDMGLLTRQADARADHFRALVENR
ncbi:HpcH/HpaI aldolase family protein [Aidingimonas halophila]|uniref:2-dehydro-3-deoxyglucarate aldolase/4-hydroxy-2-oxoheptanedioate aldolase n=1 Tax=Aidingimonas halophila TaxID=574349 RepID=A0A1H3CJ50_9GAMM|nr:HpcH/HpaI aldolase/citrate lyase family protein [Aidingimonas halophila]GHC35386.1 5-keto-4-deoxy-D-glucarate aldolase [Aidingimonas halophila]SDX54163.1 2-dehydro-3-deoxyglucarate aldolase/4-hydroxy-2-oxoheptanedioate aldolase [Aidingimonas halophila]